MKKATVLSAHVLALCIIKIKSTNIILKKNHKKIK